HGIAVDQIALLHHLAVLRRHPFSRQALQPFERRGGRLRRGGGRSVGAQAARQERGRKQQAVLPHRFPPQATLLRLSSDSRTRRREIDSVGGSAWRAGLFSAHEEACAESESNPKKEDDEGRTTEEAENDHWADRAEVEERHAVSL